MSDATYLFDKLQRLLDGVLIDLVVSQDQNDGEEYLGLIIDKDGTNYILWVEQDPEGNGPGWLSVGEEK